MAGESQDRVLAPVRRLTASEVTDDQMDALQDALDHLEKLHCQVGTRCAECLQEFPCRTIHLISRQRSRIQESTCRRNLEETP